MRSVPTIRPATAIVLLLAMAACDSDTGRNPTYSRQKILGTWTVAVTPTCIETETFRADGTTIDTSGEEITESTYSISATPNAKGAYTLTDTITKTNGKPDCGGTSTPLGDVATGYVRFDTSGNLMRTCYDSAMTQCFIMKRAADK